jgi:hypothetical protein
MPAPAQSYAPLTFTEVSVRAELGALQPVDCMRLLGGSLRTSCLTTERVEHGGLLQAPSLSRGHGLDDDIMAWGFLPTCRTYVSEPRASQLKRRAELD